MKTSQILVSIAAFAAVLGGADAPAQARAAAEARTVVTRGPLPAHEQAVVSLFEASAPSVAYITTESVQRTSLFTMGVAQGAGSGFVWDTKGHIVTNNHVVEGARKVLVALDAGNPIEATIVGRSPEYDLAVVKLKTVPKDLKPIPLGSSRELKIGQTVYAIGNPFGLTRTLTQGIVSALDRHLPTTDVREVTGAIQTDAAINPGNSGGPLLDSAGRLMGVTTAIRGSAAQSSGVGLAIPSDLVNRIVPSLIARGKAPLPGIGIDAVDPGIVARSGISGVVIAGVNEGTPAATAGFKVATDKGVVGDIIVAVNGKPVKTLSTFATEIDRTGIDGIAELTVSRDGKERKVKLKVVDLAK
ncbi:2-alkenal reductase [Betaproteobacteria bacterium GR16-43]|nr:2-alkenal reductase [Betaproteobacteria bacterium GR16-43]